MATTWLSKTLVPSGVVDHVACGTFIANSQTVQAQVVLLHAGSTLEMLAIGASGAAASISSQPLQAGDAVLDMRVLRGPTTVRNARPECDSLILLSEGGKITVLRFDERCNRFILVQEVQLAVRGMQPRFMPRMIAPSPSGRYGIAVAAFQDRIFYLPPASASTCASTSAEPAAAAAAATSDDPGTSVTAAGKASAGTLRDQVPAQPSIPGASSAAAAAELWHQPVLATPPVPYTYRRPLGEVAPSPRLTAGPVAGAALRDLRAATADALAASSTRVAASNSYLPLALEPGCGAIWDLAILEAACLGTDCDGAAAADGGPEASEAIGVGGKEASGGRAHLKCRTQEQGRAGQGNYAGGCGFRVAALIHRSSTDAGMVHLLRWIPGPPDLLLCDLVICLEGFGPSAGLPGTATHGSDDRPHEERDACLGSRSGVSTAHGPVPIGPVGAEAAGGRKREQNPVGVHAGSHRYPLLGMAHLLRVTLPEHGEAGLMILGTHGAVLLLAALLAQYTLPVCGQGGAPTRTLQTGLTDRSAIAATMQAHCIAAAAFPSPTAPDASAASAATAIDLPSAAEALSPSVEMARTLAMGCSAFGAAPRPATTEQSLRPTVLYLESLMETALTCSTRHRAATPREGPRQEADSSSSSGGGEDGSDSDTDGPRASGGELRHSKGAFVRPGVAMRPSPSPRQLCQRTRASTSNRGWAYLRFTASNFGGITGAADMANSHHIHDGDDNGLEASDGAVSGGGGGGGVVSRRRGSLYTLGRGRRTSAVSGGRNGSRRDSKVRYPGEDEDMGADSHEGSESFGRSTQWGDDAGMPVHDMLRDQVERMASMIQLYRSVVMEHASAAVAPAGNVNGDATGAGANATASRIRPALRRQHRDRALLQPSLEPSLTSLSQLQQQAHWMLRQLRRKELAAQLRGGGNSAVVVKGLRRAAAAAARAAAAAATAAAAIQDTVLEENYIAGARPLPSPPLKQAPPVLGVERLPLLEPHCEGHILNIADWLPPVLPNSAGSNGTIGPDAAAPQTSQPISRLAASSSMASAFPPIHGSVSSPGGRLLVCAASGPALCISVNILDMPVVARPVAAVAAAAETDATDATEGMQAAIVSDGALNRVATAGQLISASGQPAVGVSAVMHGADDHLPLVRLTAIPCSIPGSSIANVQGAAAAAAAAPPPSGPCTAVKPARAVAALPSWCGGTLVWSEEGGDVLIMRYRDKPVSQAQQQQQARRQLQRIGCRPRLAPRPRASPPPPSPQPSHSTWVCSAFTCPATTGFPADMNTAAGVGATAMPLALTRSSSSNLPGDGMAAGSSAAAGPQLPSRRGQQGGINGRHATPPGAANWYNDAVGTASGTTHSSGAEGPTRRAGTTAGLRRDGLGHRGGTGVGSGSIILGRSRTSKATVANASGSMTLRLLGRIPQPRPMVDFVVTEAAGVRGRENFLQVTGAVLGLQSLEGAPPGLPDPKLQVLRSCLAAPVVARMPSQGAIPTGLWSVPLRTPIAPASCTAGGLPGVPPRVSLATAAAAAAAAASNPQPGATPAGGSLIVLSFVGGSRALAPVLDTDFAAESVSGGMGFGASAPPLQGEDGAVEPSLRDVTDTLQLRYWEPTVAAGLVAEGVIVQITPSGILMASLDILYSPARATCVAAAVATAQAASGGSLPAADDVDGPGVGSFSWDAPMRRSTWPSPKSSRFDDRSTSDALPGPAVSQETLNLASNRHQRQVQQPAWHGDGRLGYRSAAQTTVSTSLSASMGMPGTEEVNLSLGTVVVDRPSQGTAAVSGGGGGSRGPSFSGYSSMAEGIGAMALTSDMQVDDEAQAAAAVMVDTRSIPVESLLPLQPVVSHTDENAAVTNGPLTSRRMHSMPPPQQTPLGWTCGRMGGQCSPQRAGDSSAETHDGGSTSAATPAPGAVEAEVSLGGVAWWSAAAADITLGAVAAGCVVLVRRLDRRITVLGVVQQTTNGAGNGGDGPGASRLSRKRPRSAIVLRELGYSLPLDSEPSCCALRLLPTTPLQPRAHSAFRRSPSASSATALAVAAAAAAEAVDSGAPVISMGAGAALGPWTGLPPLPPRPGSVNSGGSPVRAVTAAPAGGQGSAGPGGGLAGDPTGVPSPPSAGGASIGAGATTHRAAWRYQLLIGDHRPSVQLLLLTHGSSGLHCTRLARISTTVPQGLGPNAGPAGPQAAPVPESVLFIAQSPLPITAVAELGPRGGTAAVCSSNNSSHKDRQESMRRTCSAGAGGVHNSEHAALAPARDGRSLASDTSYVLCLVGLRSGGIAAFSYGAASTEPVPVPGVCDQAASDCVDDAAGLDAASLGALWASSAGGVDGYASEAMDSDASDFFKVSHVPETTESARRTPRSVGCGGGNGREASAVLRLLWYSQLEQVPLRLTSLAPCRPWQALAVGSAVHVVELAAPSARLLCSPLLPSMGTWGTATGATATSRTQLLPLAPHGLEALLAAPLYLPGGGLQDTAGVGRDYSNAAAAAAESWNKPRSMLPLPAGSPPRELALVILNDGSWRLLSLQRLSRLGRQPPNVISLGSESGVPVIGGSVCSSGFGGVQPASVLVPGTVPIGRPRLLMHVPALFPHALSHGHFQQPSSVQDVQTPLARDLDNGRTPSVAGGDAAAAGIPAGADATVRGGSSAATAADAGYLLLLADDTEGTQLQPAGSRYVHVLEASSGRQVNSFDVDAAACGFLATCACVWQVQPEAGVGGPPCGRTVASTASGGLFDDNDGDRDVLRGFDSPRAMLPPSLQWQRQWWTGGGGDEDEPAALEVAEVAMAAPPPAAVDAERRMEEPNGAAAAAAPMELDLERELQIMRNIVQFWWRSGPGAAAAAGPAAGAGMAAVGNAGGDPARDGLDGAADAEVDAGVPIDADAEVVAQRLRRLVEAGVARETLLAMHPGDTGSAAAAPRHNRSAASGVPAILVVVGCSGQGSGEVMVLQMVPALLQLMAQPRFSGGAGRNSVTAPAEVVNSPNCGKAIEQLGEDWFPWPLARTQSPMQRWLGWSKPAAARETKGGGGVEPTLRPAATCRSDDAATIRMSSMPFTSAQDTSLNRYLPTTRIVHLQVVHRLLLAKPVTAVCPYDGEALMVAAGRRLLMYTMRHGRLHRTSWVATRNPVIAMSACPARSLLACTDGATSVMLYKATHLNDDPTPGTFAGPLVSLRLIAADAVSRPITSLLLLPSPAPHHALQQPSSSLTATRDVLAEGSSRASVPAALLPGEPMDVEPVAGAADVPGAPAPTAAGASCVSTADSSAIIAATDTSGRLLLLTPGPSTLPALPCRNLITLAAGQCPDVGVRLRAHLPGPVARYNTAYPFQRTAPGLLLAGLLGAVHLVRPCPEAAVPLLSLLERALAGHWAARPPTGGRHRSAQDLEFNAADEAEQSWWCHQGHIGVLDGDFLEQLLDLPRAVRLHVLQQIPTEVLRAALAAARSGRKSEYYNSVAAVDLRRQTLAHKDEQSQELDQEDDSGMQVDAWKTVGESLSGRSGDELRLKEVSARDQPQQHGLVSRENDGGVNAIGDDDVNSVLQILQDVLAL